MAKTKIVPFDDANTLVAVKMYKTGKSVAEIARHFHSYGNPIVARLKAAGIYKGSAGTAAVSSRTAQRETVLATGTLSHEAIDAIAKGIAAAAFGDARFTPQPMTRAEMFEKIHDGVEQGVKKAGIGFHANGKGKRA